MQLNKPKCIDYNFIFSLFDYSHCNKNETKNIFQFCLQSVESFLKSFNLNHPVHSKTMLDKFAAVGILQVSSFDLLLE